MPNAHSPRPEQLTPEQQARQRVAAAKRRRHKEEQRRRALRRYYAFLAFLALLALLLVFGAVKAIQSLIQKDDSSSPGAPSSSAAAQSGANSGSSASGGNVDFTAGSGTDSANPAPSSSSQAGTAPADPTAWYLLLANTQNPLPDGYAPELVSVGTNARNGEMYVDKRTEQAFLDLLAAAKADGIDLIVRSAYRSHEEQTYLFNSMKQEYMNQGMSEEEALAATKKLRNVPGTSEHETGLCADFTSSADLNADLVPELSERDWAIWLKEHAADYGFILRYPEDKTDLTGTSFEPWHYRYVGVEDAKSIMSQGLCLEEYLAS